MESPSGNQPQDAAGENDSLGSDGGEGLAEYFNDRRLAKDYAQACQSQGRPVNPLVERSLLESIEARQASWFVEAPGSHPRTFSSRLDNSDMMIFSQVFSGPVQWLVRLDLSYNVITDEGVTILARALLGQRARRLEAFSIRGNSMGPEGCKELGMALMDCPSLYHVDVSQNPLGRTGGLHVVELLKARPDLEEIVMADTEIDIDVLVATSKALLDGSHRLRLCNVENPRIQTLQEDHTVHLGRMLRVNTHLSEIYFGKHKMRDEGVRQLVDFLLENKTLKVLDLRCNELGSDGAGHLARLLSSDCQLTRLNLSGNRIGENDNVEGARALAEALLNNRLLNHLDLNKNRLCGQSLQLLADAVDKNSTLESIALFHNLWDQSSSFKFHQILNDKARILPFRADFITSEVDLRIDVCQVQDFDSNPSANQ